MTANFSSFCQLLRHSLTGEGTGNPIRKAAGEVISLATFYEDSSIRAHKSWTSHRPQTGSVRTAEIIRPAMWNGLYTFKSYSKLFGVCFNLITPLRRLIKYMVRVAPSAGGTFQPLQESYLSPTLDPLLLTTTQETGEKVTIHLPKDTMF